MLSCSVTSDSLCPHNYSPPGSSTQEYWRGLPFPTSRGSSDPGIKPTSLASPALAEGLFTTEPPGKPMWISGALIKGIEKNDS